MRTSTRTLLLETTIVAGHVAWELAPVSDRTALTGRLVLLGVHVVMTAWHWLCWSRRQQRPQG